MFGSTKPSAREEILKLLANQPGLSSKKIHHCISRQLPLTYQAVHKALIQLTAEEVLQRNGFTYSLSPAWIKKFQKFFDLAAAISNNPDRIKLSSMTNGSAVTLHFNEKWTTPFYWLLDELSELCAVTPPNRPTLIIMYGAWPIMVMGKKEYEELRKITQSTPTKLVCTTNHFLDGVILDFWKKRFNTPYVMNVDSSNRVDQILFGDYLVQIYNPPEIALGFLKSLGKQVLDLPRIYQLCFENKAKVTITITRNRGLVEQQRKYFLHFFKKTT